MGDIESISDDFPIIVAHRGYHRNHPENSIGAVNAALTAGFGWIECDVWATSDGLPIVIHDETLDRTTTGTGCVWQRPWHELQRLRLRQPDGTPHCVEHLPLYRTVCASGATVLVEIKPPDARELVTEIAKADVRCEQMLQSFDERNLIHCLTANPRLPVAMLVEDRAALERAVAAGWDRINLCHELLDRKTADWLRDSGVRVGVWTVNVPEDILRVIELGAKMIITDEPVFVRNLLGRAPLRKRDK